MINIPNNSLNKDNITDNILILFYLLIYYVFVFEAAVTDPEYNFFCPLIRAPV